MSISAWLACVNKVPEHMHGCIVCMGVCFTFIKSRFRLLHDGLETRPGSCARNVDSIKEGYACLGEELNMFGAISDDFGKTQQCNYYIFPSNIATLIYSMAFRVSLKQ